MTFYRKSSWNHIVIVETLDTGPLPALSSVSHLWDLSVVVAWEDPAAGAHVMPRPRPGHSLPRHELGLVWALASWLTLGCPPRLAQEEMRVKGENKNPLDINTVTCYFLSPCQMLHENTAQHCAVPGTSFASWKNEKYKTFEDMGVLTWTIRIL